MGQERRLGRQLGFRGAQDVESPGVEWTRIEAVVEGGKLTYYVNGKLVNAASDSSFKEGRIMIQSEGAEITSGAWSFSRSNNTIRYSASSLVRSSQFAVRRVASFPRHDVANAYLSRLEHLGERAAAPALAHQFLKARMRLFHLFAGTRLAVDQQLRSSPRATPRPRDFSDRLRRPSGCLGVCWAGRSAPSASISSAHRSWLMIVTWRLPTAVRVAAQPAHDRGRGVDRVHRSPRPRLSQMASSLPGSNVTRHRPLIL